MTVGTESKCILNLTTLDIPVYQKILEKRQTSHKVSQRDPFGNDFAKCLTHIVFRVFPRFLKRKGI